MELRSKLLFKLEQVNLCSPNRAVIKGDEKCLAFLERSYYSKKGSKDDISKDITFISWIEKKRNNGYNNA